MNHHAERVRRIQELCAQLDTAIKASHNVQETVDQLHAESRLLLQDMGDTPKSKADDRATTRFRARARKSGS